MYSTSTDEEKLYKFGRKIVRRIQWPKKIGEDGCQRTVIYKIEEQIIVK